MSEIIKRFSKCKVKRQCLCTRKLGCYKICKIAYTFTYIYINKVSYFSSISTFEQMRFDTEGYFVNRKA